MATYANVSVFKDPNLGHIGWKYYNNIKKKAMEQEFSFSGLLISLSIAFFIVIIAASGLNLTYKSLSDAKNINFLPTNLYILEGTHDYSLNNYLNKEVINTEKLKNIEFRYLS
jgi:hypothetical protein